MTNLSPSTTGQQTGSTSPPGIEGFSSDFGHILWEAPGGVQAPSTVESVQALLLDASRTGERVTARGFGHSATGQSMGRGLVLDLRDLRGITSIDADRGVLRCFAGTPWSEVARAALEHGLLPPVLTNNLSVSVGGTLSVAGLGTASFRQGAQGDQVNAVRVVTADGRDLLCSRDTNSELFDLVRGGLGQFGVIVEAWLRLRPAPARIRRTAIVYDTVGAWLAATEALMDDPSVLHLEGFCSPLTLGVRSVGPDLQLGTGKVPFARWYFPLWIGTDADAPRPDFGTPPSGTLAFEDEWTAHDFAFRMEPIFELWRASGYWDQAHPWTELILPWDSVEPFLSFVLPNLPPTALGPGGHVLLWPARGSASHMPNFRRPPGERLVGWGLLPGVPHARLDEALQKLGAVAALARSMGGVHYPSGWLGRDLDTERWRQHYGDRYDVLVEAKRRWDPQGLLGGRFLGTGSEPFAGP